MMSRRTECGLSVVLALFSLSASGRASAQEIQAYRVRTGDSCGSIAARVYGNSRRYDLIHEHNPELGAMPHRLEPGTTLRLLQIEVNHGADATVTSVRRSVGSQPPESGDWRRAQVGQELEQGWRVNTEERSSAELTFRSSSVAQIREQTLVIIYGSGVRRARREGARAVLLEGGLLSRISGLSGDQPLEVETPSSLATLRTGETSVDVEDDGSTRVAVHSGEAATVSRLNGSGEVSVPVGSGTRVQRGRPPSRPRPLPRAPRWSDAQPDTFLSLGDQGGTIVGSWQPRADAVRYRIEIARRRDGRELILSQEVPAEVTQLQFHRLPPGTYFARVITIDRAAFEGRPGRPTALTVHGMDMRFAGAAEFTGVRPADPFGLATLDDTTVPEDDTQTDDAATHQIPVGTTLRFPSSMRCRVGEASPAAEVQLRTIGATHIDCEGSVDDLAVEVVPVSAEIFADDGRSPVAVSMDGGPTPVRIQLSGLHDVSQLQIVSSDVTASSIESLGDGSMRAVLARTEPAGVGEGIRLAIRTGDGIELANLVVPYAARTADAASPVLDQEQSELRSAQEAFGLPLYASWVGLTDERRRGSGMHLAATVTSAEEGDADPTVRITAGLRAALFSDRLRIDVAVPLDALGGTERTARRGSRDLFVAVSSLILDEEDFGLAAEAGIFTPTAGAQGLDRARLRIAVDGSLRVLDDRLILRTRQAGVFDLESDGSLLWASAYGADVWIAGPFSAGAEVALVLGQDDGREAIGAGVGLATHLDFGAIDVSLAGRVGFGAPRLVGLLTLSLAVRGTVDLGAM